MQASQIALILTIVFMLASLYIGIRAGSKVTTIRDYVLGNKNFSVMALTLTYIATCIGGGTIFGDSIGEYGVVVFFSTLGLICSHFLRARYISTRMSKFRDCLTMGDMVESMYGTRAKQLTGFLGLLISIMIVVMQLNALGIISQNFLGVDARIGIILGALVLGGYSALGGIKSVTATDIFQCIVLFITLIVISNAVVNKIGGIDIMINKLPEISSNNYDLKKIYTWGSMFIMWVVFFSEMLNPAIMQRLLMANSKNQLKKMFLSVGSIDIVIRFLLLTISLGCLILYPNTPSGDIVYKCTTEILPNNLYGIIVIGLVAIVASTIDSFMHSGGICFGIDCFSKSSDKDKIKYSKIGTIIISISAALLSIYKISSLTQLNFRGVQLMSITITCPLILGIFDVKPSKKGFWVACISSILACIILTFTLPDVYEPLATLFAMIVNGIVYLGFNYLENGKIIINEDPNLLNIRKKKDSVTLKNIIERYVGKFNVSVQNYYLLFGSVCLVSTITPLFFYGVDGFSMSGSMICIKVITVFLCTLLIAHDAWNENFKKFLPIFYNISITYCLPFLGASMFLLTNGRIEWLTNFAIGTMFLIMIVDHFAFFIHMIIGVGAAWLFFGNSIILENGISISASNMYLLGSQIFMATVIGLLFAKKRQAHISLIDYQKRVVEKLEKMKSRDLYEIESSKDKLLKLLGREEVDIVNKLNSIEESLKSDNCEKAALSVKNVKEYIESIIDRATDYFRLSVEKVDLQQFASEIEKIFKSEGDRDVYTILTSTRNNISCDKISLLKMLTQILTEQQMEAFKIFENNSQEVYIYISDAKIMYEVKDIPYYSRTLDAIKFTVSSSDHLDKEILEKTHKVQLVRPEKIPTISLEDIDKKSVERAVEAHYGALLDEGSKKNSAIFSVCLPKDIYEIRPSTIDMKDPEERLQLWPAAVELEREFIEKIQSSYPELSLEKISKALELIKKYHAHQQRKSGEPYYMHPINVAMLVIDIMKDNNSNIYGELNKMKEVIIISALLHDILEDTVFHPLDMKVQFGDAVTQTVAEVTKIDFEERQRLLTNGEAFKKLMQQNPAVVCIKLADRLHNILTINGHPNLQKRKAVAQETLDFFVPPAEKMGLIKLSQELSRLSKVILEKGGL